MEKTTLVFPKKEILTSSDVVRINKEREKIDSLYYIRRAINSLEGLNLLLQKRKEFWKRNHQMLGEFVLWGRYLLTYRATVQAIDQDYLEEKPTDVMTLTDFMRTISSLRTTELEDFPKAPAICEKCNKPISIQDIAKGNFKKEKGEFIHVDC